MMQLIGLSLIGCRPLDVQGMLSAWESPPEGVTDELWEDARKAWGCGARAGQTWTTMLGIVDFSQPSEERRFWVIDMDSHDLVVYDRVAHGSGSGGRRAGHFSNVAGSHASSLGLYRATWPYQGKNGLSLKLDGLEPSNNAAMSRSVVIHPSSYVDESWIARHGQAGTSHGCFSVDPDLSETIIDALRGGLLFAWSDDERWQHESPFLGGCDLQLP